jgi:hypothetical protein
MVSAIAVMSAEQYELATKHAQDFSDMTKRHNRLMADLTSRLPSRWARKQWLRELRATP